MKRLLSVLFLVGLIIGNTGARNLHAMPDNELMNRLEELERSIQRQQEEIRYLKQLLEEQKAAAEKTKEKDVAEIKKLVSEELKGKEAPEWIKRIKLGGDLRLRYEGIYNREKREADSSTTDLPTRDRYRIRARLFVDGKVSDEVKAHFMICTNQDQRNEATTTNQSFSNDFNDKDIYLHRAYATYKPKWLEGLEITAGKFKNTFLHTDIMWDPDVNPEGIYERYQYRAGNTFQPFVQLGQMAVNEENLQTDDAALYIYQGGFDWKIGPVKWTLAGSYYDWANLHNSEYLHSAQYKRGGGNSFFTGDDGTLQYMYDYNLLEAITSLSFKVGSVPTKLTFDYINNVAGDVPSDHDTAYFAGFKLGKNKKEGDMSLGYKYARIERDSVIGSMNDQDFYGANRKGHKVTLNYMLLDKLRFKTAYFYTDPVTDWIANSANWSNEQAREHEDRLQGDLIFSF